MLNRIIICLVSLSVSISLYSTPAVSASLPEVKPDKGLVVFYRSKSMKGAAIHMLIKSSDGAAGNLTSGSMFYKYYEPGQRTFDVSTPSVAGSDLITLDIDAGETYFVRGEILMGWPAGRPRLTQEQESRAVQDIGKL
jgi:hypothetical protein